MKTFTNNFKQGRRNKLKRKRNDKNLFRDFFLVFEDCGMQNSFSLSVGERKGDREKEKLK